MSVCLSALSGLAFAELTRRREGWGTLAGSVVVTLALVGLAFGLFILRTPDVRALLASGGVYANWAIMWPLSLGAGLTAWTLLGRALGTGQGALVACAAVLIGLHVFDLTMLHYRMPWQRLEYADIVRDEAVLRPRMLALRDELHRTGERVLAPDGSKNLFLLPNLTRPWACWPRPGPVRWGSSATWMSWGWVGRVMSILRPFRRRIVALISCPSGTRSSRVSHPLQKT